jgi:membrane protein
MIFDTEPPQDRTWLNHFAPTARYCMCTEVHVYALAISASVLLSFFPFLIVMISLCRYGFHWHAAEKRHLHRVERLFSG